MPVRSGVGLFGRSSRPALAKTPARRPPTRGCYATLHAPTRTATRLAIHPSFFLVHLGGISLASCMIPVIAARRTVSSQAAESDGAATLGGTPEPTSSDPPFPFIYPVQQPFPPLHQRRRLAAQLRRQIETAPLDAAFNLRQLRLVNEEPEIHLPPADAPPTPYTVLSNLRPVQWVWRFPATVALHSILRSLRDTSGAADPRGREALLPIAVSIAKHSVRFDALMWNATLRGQQQQGALEWERLVADERRRTSTTPEAQEKVRVVTRLPKRARERTGDPKLELWEAKHREMAERSWEASSGRRTIRPRGGTAASETADDTRQTAMSPSIRPAISIPTASLDALFLHLVEVEKNSPAVAADALDLADSLSRARRRRSRRAIHRSFQLALDAEKQDLAAEFWVDYLAEVRLNRDRPGMRWLDRLLHRLMSHLRTHEGAFVASPNKVTLAAVATLTRALDDLVSPGAPASISPVSTYLLRTLATFPPAPFASDLEPGSSLRKQARAHRRVFDMIKEVMRRVLEDVSRREIHLGPVKSRLGAPIPAKKKAPPILQRLGVLDYNTLISYALLKLQSPELAMLLVERMGEHGLRPTPATQNIVFSAMGGGTDLDTLERLLQRKDDPRAVPVFLRHLAETASFEHLDAIVFRLLPELHYELDEATANGALPPVRQPDIAGRSPYLYTTLLHVLSCAGRIGLAERVFRNARWAAEVSRARAAADAGKKARGWVLPPHAFTIMLQMYAREVRRGRQLERRDAQEQSAPPSDGGESSAADVSSSSTPFVRGWGRHALRVFLLQEQRSRLQEQLGRSALPQAVAGLSQDGSTSSGPSSSSPFQRRQRRLLTLPPFLRSEAAPIAAMWELEGGSKEPELESLEKAMKSPHAEEALRELFPPPPELEHARMSPQAQLTDARRKSWRRGYRAGQDVLKERVRRRSEALQRHALVPETASS
ncbi:hypothetical protein BMF94_2837 [Rhodotorula taiwanensis]|uniref:Uncharacterized protein n=1 Tax=Rhodotorula taiwanensis TaxID=741276 RepID=A0A2S5BB74_9BASI|nr:hypothetical protein BMF94_2837 [Rhodotorula taiwanensis]